MHRLTGSGLSMIHRYTIVDRTLRLLQKLIKRTNVAITYDVVRTPQTSDPRYNEDTAITRVEFL